MPDKLDEILAEVRNVKSEQRELKSWLYGADGHEGDVPAIKKQVGNHGKRIRVLEIIIAGLIVSCGGIIGLLKLLG